MRYSLYSTSLWFEIITWVAMLAGLYGAAQLGIYYWGTL